MKNLRVNWDFNGKTVEIPTEIFKKFSESIYKLEAEMVTKNEVSQVKFTEVLDNFYKEAFQYLYLQFQKTEAGKNIETLESFTAEIEVGAVPKPMLFIDFGYGRNNIHFGDSFRNTYIIFFTGMLEHIDKYQISKEKYEEYCESLDEFCAFPETDNPEDLLKYLEKLVDLYNKHMPIHQSFSILREGLENAGYEAIYKIGKSGSTEYSTKAKINHLLYEISSF